ncbi:hypothetical protein B0J18DRAFT_292574 [Chaetomium sp. MPI-SDFR-AT-0129]|nr:hypothetical protein B0J18DRAFT_292574 [Chaetomium sp. MPI-SDFR-AT-0129]
MSQSEETKRIIQKIQANGKKIQPNATVRAWKVPATSEVPMATPAPEHMWVETGHGKAGLGHMQSEIKIRQFATDGIPENQQREKLPVLAQAHTTVGRYLGVQGRNRPVMATHIDGRVQKHGITVADNGYIVSMNTVTSGKLTLKPGAPPPVSDKTIETLYRYPANCPERRATGGVDQQKDDGIRPPKRGDTA